MCSAFCKLWTRIQVSDAVLSVHVGGAKYSSELYEQFSKKFAGYRVLLVSGHGDTQCNKLIQQEILTVNEDGTLVVVAKQEPKKQNLELLCASMFLWGGRETSVCGASIDAQKSSSDASGIYGVACWSFDGRWEASWQEAH